MFWFMAADRLAATVCMARRGNSLPETRSTGSPKIGAPPSKRSGSLSPRSWLASTNSEGSFFPLHAHSNFTGEADAMHAVCRRADALEGCLKEIRQGEGAHSHSPTLLRPTKRNVGSVHSLERDPSVQPFRDLRCVMMRRAGV